LFHEITFTHIASIASVIFHFWAKIPNESIFPPNRNQPRFASSTFHQLRQGIAVESHASIDDAMAGEVQQVYQAGDAAMMGK